MWILYCRVESSWTLELILKASVAITTYYIKANDLRAYQDQQIIILYVVLSSQFNVAPYKPNKPTSAPVEATVKCNIM
ncbi:hypothetical protein HMPREF1544_04990 [Mucor circinelloides 1006PhL]|uniref:Uncharacterized protein n=1 Tax=Mucor circinelloides f. circinelloides (strain 1006PhL) TaxID=1220926 RepID=S2JZ96_MUCC1|nr:hypothetical protein HMPREF1544_04990 [Mucor circinelloides 1006PhL]